MLFLLVKDIYKNVNFMGSRWNLSKMNLKVWHKSRILLLIFKSEPIKWQNSISFAIGGVSNGIVFSSREAIGDSSSANKACDNDSLLEFISSRADSINFFSFGWLAGWIYSSIVRFTQILTFITSIYFIKLTTTNWF